MVPGNAPPHSSAGLYKGAEGTAWCTEHPQCWTHGLNLVLEHSMVPEERGEQEENPPTDALGLGSRSLSVTQ